MDTVQRRAEIHRPRAERIFRAAFHVARQIGAALEHFRGRRPRRPFLLGGNPFHAGPGEARLADTDAVAHRLTVALHQIEKLVRRIDDDGAGRLLAVIRDHLLFESRIETLARRRHLPLRRIDRARIIRLDHHAAARLGLRLGIETARLAAAEDELDEAAAHVGTFGIGDADRRRRRGLALEGDDPRVVRHPAVVRK
jgi:hypothetical protein